MTESARLSPAACGTQPTSLRCPEPFTAAALVHGPLLSTHLSGTTTHCQLNMSAFKLPLDVYFLAAPICCALAAMVTMTARVPLRDPE